MIRHLRPFRFVLPLVFLAFPLVAQLSNPNDKPDGPTNVQVYITFDNNRQVDEQFRVELYDASGILMTQGYADLSGRAVFRVTGRSGYTVKVSGASIQGTASESFENFYCPSSATCTHQVSVRVKAKDEAAKSTATQSAPSSGNPPVTSAAELRVPQSARKAFDQGVAAWQKKDFQQAAEKFEKAVADYPEYDTAYNNLGVMYAHLGQNDKAMAAFKRSVELNDKNADADRNLARMLMRQKDYAQAEQLLKKALTVQAPDAATLTMLAITEIQNGQVDEALKDAQKVHGLPHDGYALVHYISGEALEEKHQYTQATVEYTTYLRESPNGPEAAEVKSALERLSNSTAKVTPNPQ